MKPTWRHWLRVLVVGAWALVSILALAVAAEPGADPPARVGRISLANGQVDALIEPGGAWSAAQLNTPVTSGSALRAQIASRAEVRVGTASVQVNANTHLAFATLDDHTLIIELQRGGIEIQPHALAASERIEVRADGARFVVNASGIYRIDYLPGMSHFEVQVFEGAGTLAGRSGAIELAAGRQGVVDTRMLFAQDSGDARRRPFDDWAVQREDRMRLRESPYVSPEMTGAEALQGHGVWRVEPTVGAVWYPTAVALDWAPYRYGRWVWVSPWGWTWVDDAAWGFAPFHYGRWLFLGGRWGWVPGPLSASPCYAPALVGFYGRAGGVQAGGAASTGADVVGWFPLAPGEVYRPGYATSAQYLRVLNGDVAARAPANGMRTGYRYAQTSFAATAVARDAFGLGQAVATARIALGPASLANAVAVDHAAAVLPPRPAIATPGLPTPRAVPEGAPVQEGSNPQQLPPMPRAAKAPRGAKPGDAKRPPRVPRNPHERSLPP
jgi:hypothetical protein